MFWPLGCYQVHLLEVNPSPGMSHDTSIMGQMLGVAVRGLLDLVLEGGDDAELEAAPHGMQGIQLRLDALPTVRPRGVVHDSFAKVVDGGTTSSAVVVEGGTTSSNDGSLNNAEGSTIRERMDANGACESASCSDLLELKVKSEVDETMDAARKQDIGEEHGMWRLIYKGEVL